MKIYEINYNNIENKAVIMTHDKYLSDILNLIVTVTTNATHIKICSIWLKDNHEDSEILNLRATQSINPEYMKNHSITMKEGVVGYVATNRETIIVKDVLRDTLFNEKEMAGKSGLVSMIGIPMIYKEDQLLGVLNCFTTIPHNFSDEEVEKLTAIANQAAVIIMKTQGKTRRRLIKEELDTRVLFNRAKKVFMHRWKINADEADKRLRNYSIQNCKSIKNIAEAILLLN